MLDTMSHKIEVKMPRLSSKLIEASLIHKTDIDAFRASKLTKNDSSHHLIIIQWWKIHLTYSFMHIGDQKPLCHPNKLLLQNGLCRCRWNIKTYKIRPFVTDSIEGGVSGKPWNVKRQNLNPNLHWSTSMLLEQTPIAKQIAELNLECQIFLEMKPILHEINVNKTCMNLKTISHEFQGYNKKIIYLFQFD